jgi:hypothetical protein
MITSLSIAIYFFEASNNICPVRVSNRTDLDEYGNRFCKHFNVCQLFSFQDLDWKQNNMDFQLIAMKS